MDPVTIGMGALALYALFARPARHDTPEEWAARTAEKCEVDVAGYAKHLAGFGVSGVDLEQMMARVSALRDGILAQCAQVQGADLASTGDQPLADLSMTDGWCNPDEIEDEFGNCIPVSPSTQGVISRGMTGRVF